jgi:hypothetical protein
VLSGLECSVVGFEHIIVLRVTLELFINPGLIGRCLFWISPLLTESLRHIKPDIILLWC